MDELLTWTPGEFDEQELALLAEKTREVRAFQDRGPLDIQALIDGTLPEDIPVYGAGCPKEIADSGRAGRLITKEDCLELAERYNPDNPFYNDEDYAKRTKWGGLCAMPSLEVAGFMPKMPNGMGDNMVVSGLNHTLTYYQPIKAGDRLFRVYDSQGYREITIPGSTYRTFQVYGTGRSYNQRGELVSEGASIVKESFNRYADPAERTYANCWESPDWWKQRPYHNYTDEDWDTIKAYWDNEYIRGSETLYWEDVNIGDEPTPTLDGPVISPAASAGLVDDCGPMIQAIRTQYCDPELRKHMTRDEHGIYVPVVPPQTPPPMPEPDGDNPPPPMPVEGKKSSEKLSDGRFVFMNTLARRFAQRMITNWMGDDGFLHREGWCIMPVVYGYDGLIPDHDWMPELFDKTPYFEKVPYLKDKRALVHGLAGDVSINRAYVTDKYIDSNGRHLVDLVWWCETIEGDIFQEGFFTVQLPSRETT